MIDAVTVFIADDQSDHQVDLACWDRLARNVLRTEGVHGAAEMALTFVDEVTIADLNRRYMGSDGPTDVLSFPIDGELRHSPEAGDMPLMLGDVVICPVVAARNAPDHAGNLEDEIALLVVHGILHLLGFDHMEDEERRVMQAREQDLLVAFHGEPARNPWS